MLFDVLRHRRFHATELPAVKPTVAEILADPDQPDLLAGVLRPRLPGVRLPADPRLRRGRARAGGAAPLGDGAAQPVPLGPDPDPADPGRRAARRRLRRGVPPAQPRGARLHPPGDAGTGPRPPHAAASAPRAGDGQAARPPVPAGPRAGTVRGAAASWRRWPWSRASGCAPTRTSSATPPTAGRRCRRDEITEKTGIESRVYTARPLEDIALQAARAALRHAGRGPEEIGAVLFCTCTSTRLMPSVATWLSGQLGIAADPRLVRHRGRLRRAALRAGRGDPAAAGGRPPGAAGLRGEVLRQDRHGPAAADDLRRRGRRAGHRAGGAGRADRHRGAADLRQRPGQRGQLDHLAEPGVRQQHHRLRPGGALAGRALPQADDRGAEGAGRPGRRGGHAAGQHRPDRARTRPTRR